MFTIDARRYDDPVVATLVAEVQAEYVVRYGGPDRARVEPGEFVPPRGLFLVGTLNGDPVATGGWRRLAGDVAEIKRMFVSIRARRRGLGRLLLVELEARADEAGIQELVLNTGTEQPEAIALYESAGYLPVPGFGYYAGAPKARFYGKRLRPDDTRPVPQDAERGGCRVGRVRRG